MRYDVFRLRQDMVLDVQNDLIDGLNTRIVVPLFPRDAAPIPVTRLNPIIRLDGDDYVMLTQFLAAVSLAELGASVTNLSSEHDRIVAALDMIFQGF